MMPDPRERSSPVAVRILRRLADPQEAPGLKPVRIDEETKASYAGDFTPFQINYENGGLFLSRQATGRLTMIPLDEDTFMIKEVDYFRVHMEKEKGQVVALKGIWRDGRTQAYPKAKQK